MSDERITSKDYGEGYEAGYQAGFEDALAQLLEWSEARVEEKSEKQQREEFMARESAGGCLGGSCDD